jgi:hypothetical protein
MVNTLRIFDIATLIPSLVNIIRIKIKNFTHKFKNYFIFLFSNCKDIKKKLNFQIAPVEKLK